MADPLFKYLDLKLQLKTNFFELMSESHFRNNIIHSRNHLSA